MTDDEKVARHVSQKYGELGREEPPRALDDAILAAARHSVRPWTQRWAVPLSIAAVLVLSVTVTLRIQQEQPGIESPVTQVKKQEMEQVKEKEPAPAAPAAAPVAGAQPRAKAERQQKPVVRKAPEPFANAAQDKVAADKPAAAAAAPAPAPLENLASRRDAGRGAESSAAGVMAQAPAAKASIADTPERELERIAELRLRGMHDEADKALAEFRKRYPDYVIAGAMRARVERR
jgi:hypothetical protein